jgi:hypothetical protein
VVTRLQSARPLGVLLIALGLCGAPAGGALSLGIGSNADPAQPDEVFSRPPAGPQFFDLTFTETGPPGVESLYAYDIEVRVVRPSGVEGGVRLLTGRDAVDVTPQDFVFPSAVRAGWRILETDADHLLATIRRATSSPVDITTGKKAGRVFYTVDPDAAPGTYSIVFNPLKTVFGSNDPRGPLEIVVDQTDRGVIVLVPEPRTLTLIALCAAVALWRGRSKSAAAPRRGSWPYCRRAAGRSSDAASRAADLAS